MAIRKKTNVPKDETPEARFVRVATMKVNSLIRNYRTLARLTGKKAKSTPEQRKAILEALTAAQSDAMEALNGKATTATGFKL